MCPCNLWISRKCYTDLEYVIQFICWVIVSQHGKCFNEKNIYIIIAVLSQILNSKYSEYLLVYFNYLFWIGFFLFCYLKDCVRRRVMKSVMANPYCSEAAAKDAMEAVWDVCYNDTQPFDRAPWSAVTSNLTMLYMVFEEKIVCLD